MKQYRKKYKTYNALVINMLCVELDCSKRFIYQSINKQRKSQRAYEVRKMYWIMNNTIENNLKNIAR